MMVTKRLKLALDNQIKREVHCIHCGARTLGIIFRCHKCGKWKRSLFLHFISLVLFLFGAALSIIFVQKISPEYADAIRSGGKEPFYAIELFISFHRFIFTWYWLCLPPVTLLFTYLALVWRSDRETGVRIVLLSALLYMLAGSIVFLLTLHQMVGILPAVNGIPSL